MTQCACDGFCDYIFFHSFINSWVHKADLVLFYFILFRERESAREREREINEKKGVLLPYTGPECYGRIHTVLRSSWAAESINFKVL